MLKGISIIFLSCAMAFAILAPSALLLLNMDANSVNIVEITEEENKTENKKLLEDHKIIDRSAYEIVSLITRRSSIYLFYKEEFSNLFSAVFIPPPEYIS